MPKGFSKFKHKLASKIGNSEHNHKMLTSDTECFSLEKPGF